MSVRLKGEDVFNAGVEHPGDAKGQFQRWKVLGVLDGNDGLAGDTDAVGQVFLRHFVMFETEAAYVVADQRFGH